jgi:hypothetical protein
MQRFCDSESRQQGAYEGSAGNGLESAGSGEVGTVRTWKSLAP